MEGSQLELTAQNLEALDKNQLIKMVLDLNTSIIKLQEDYKRVIDFRLYNLERSVNLNQQYLRRDSIEISGIPPTVTDDKIEDEVIELFKDAKVTLNRQNLKKTDIQAAHRKGKKGVVIVKMVNRKFARTALVSKKNLAGNKRYGDDTNIYFNDSFTPEFGYLNYIIRKMYKQKRIYRYKVKNGVNHVQLEEGGNFVVIGHAKDLINLGIDVPPRQ